MRRHIGLNRIRSNSFTEDCKVIYVMDSLSNFARNVGIGTWLRRCRQSRTLTSACCTRGDCSAGNSGTTSRIAINQLIPGYVAG